jgi:hypothetical protein
MVCCSGFEAGGKVRITLLGGKINWENFSMQKGRLLHHTNKFNFMTALLKSAVAILLVSAFAGASFISSKKHSSTIVPSVSPTVMPNAQAAAPKIQAAILLDVSNSMDGLIEQAKAQLWNMVSVMGKAKCNGAAPQIEIALYEYGSPRNDAKKGYVKQLSPFTTDLDSLSKLLFGLTTDGGDEYCGQVIYTALDNLAWEAPGQHYKVIFIAGNEDFLQGSVHFTKACELAKQKGILVNTIYCGDRLQGIREHWNLGTECGDGSFTTINQNAKEEDIPTPYDSSLVVLNTQLNNTYIGYGSRGVYGYSAQASVDAMNFSTNKPAALKRIAVKGKKELYNNKSWDMVDAAADDGTFVEKLDTKTLPDSLKNKSKAELQELIKAKKEERTAVQNQIASLSAQRETYLAAERKRRAGAAVQTLETETEKLIRTQAKKFNMMIE